MAIKRCLRVKWYQTAGIPKEIETLRERATILIYTHLSILLISIAFDDAAGFQYYITSPSK
jgi:hypothetical protein